MVLDSIQNYIGELIGKYVPPRFRRYVPKRFLKFIPEPQSERYARLLLITGVCFLVLGILLFSIVETSLYIHSLQNFELIQAQRHAKRAQPVVAVLSTISFSQIPDIEAWKYGLQLGSQLKEVQALSDSLTQNVVLSGEKTSIAPLIPTITALSDTTEKLEENIDNSILVKKMIPADKRALLAQANQALTQLEPLSTLILTGRQTWVVIFQNSDELRAAGGFAGSYALVTLEDGVLSEVVVEDIYDADGQFAGYLEAPAGMKEYTSSSRGLRLPDANWFPHFPQSAQTMLQFFAFGKKRDIKGVITVNLPVAEAVLRLTGPLPIPDYNTEVTADNLHSVLREERDSFFPGSIQKKHILSQAVAVLRQRLLELSPSQQLAIFAQLVSDASRKEIQIYALDPELETLLSNYGVTGEVGLNELQKKQLVSDCPPHCTQPPRLLYLVESNVGINKTNRFIARSVTLSENNGKITISIEFYNKAPKNSTTLLSPAVGLVESPLKQIANNGYANYQRLLVSPDYTLESATINGMPVDKIDSEVLTYDTATANQYGFLIIILPEETATLEMELTPNLPQQTITDRPLLLQKQSGLAPTPYTIIFPNFTESFILEKDKVLTWQ